MIRSIILTLGSLILIGCYGGVTTPTFELTMHDVCLNAVNGQYKVSCGDVDAIYVEYEDKFVENRYWYYDMTQYAIDDNTIPLPCTEFRAPMTVRIYCGSSGIVE